MCFREATLIRAMPSWTPKLIWTPTVTHTRFDPRFFVSEVPLLQIARHDDYEATESVWLTPRNALQHYSKREIELAPPQIMSLAHLSHYNRVEDVLHAARQRKPPVIAPEAFQQEGSLGVCYPGDARHRLQERALPGPSRLIYRNKRFEPAGGFEGLFTPSPEPFADPRAGTAAPSSSGSAVVNLICSIEKADETPVSWAALISRL